MAAAAFYFALRQEINGKIKTECVIAQSKYLIRYNLGIWIVIKPLSY